MSKKNPKTYLVAATWPREMYGVDDNADFKYAATPAGAKKIASELEKKGATSTSIAMVIPEKFPELGGTYKCPECGSKNLSVEMEMDGPFYGITEAAELLSETVRFFGQMEEQEEELECDDCEERFAAAEAIAAA